MNKNLNELRNEFPELYEHIAFECNSGWYELLRKLSIQIREHLKDCDEAQSWNEFRVEQVKEKYGTLRYYVDNACNDIYKFIHEAEDASCNTCEECGKPGMEFDLGWTYTRCPVCLKQLKEYLELGKMRHVDGELNHE